MRTYLREPVEGGLVWTLEIQCDACGTVASVKGEACLLPSLGPPRSLLRELEGYASELGWRLAPGGSPEAPFLWDCCSNGECRKKHHPPANTNT